MAVSEKKKASNAKWDRENMATLGARVKKTEAEAFREYAAAHGKTANAMLKDYILRCIKSEE